MEAQKIAQSVFDESYENDPKNEHDNNNMEKALVDNWGHREKDGL